MRIDQDHEWPTKRGGPSFRLLYSRSTLGTRKPQGAAGKRKPQEEAIGAVIFGSDQGLVGRFNEVLVEFAMCKVKSLPGKLTNIWAVGERAQELLADTGMTQAGVLSVPNSVNAITPVIGRILVDIQAARERGEVVAVYLFHNHPKSESS
jgi:F-type H+-transporting ATPase subunit gamma